VTSTVADSAALTPEDADTLRTKVREAGLLDVPPRTNGPHDPDTQSYEITVEAGDRPITTVLDEHDLSPAIRSLIDWIESVPGHEETVDSPG
jgi:hypothetical protein